MDAVNNLEIRKSEINRELNNLVDIKNKANALESEAQYGIEEDMRGLKAIEDMLEEDKISLSDITDDIRQQLKQHDVCSQESATDGIEQLERRITELEDELESIARESSSI